MESWWLNHGKNRAIESLLKGQKICFQLWLLLKGESSHYRSQCLCMSKDLHWIQDQNRQMSLMIKFDCLFKVKAQMWDFQSCYAGTKFKQNCLNMKLGHLLRLVRVQLYQIYSSKLHQLLNILPWKSFQEAAD